MRQPGSKIGLQTSDLRPQTSDLRPQPSPEDASGRAAKHQPGHPIPVILLARLAVDKSEQKRGLGPALVKNTLQRCLAGSKQIGARAVLVHAIDADAKSFYQHYGFEECTVSELHLMLLMKDIEAIK